MCGICGIVSADSLRPADPVALRRMGDVMTLRGPDDAGLCVQGHAGPAMRRLSIIDLETGRQPILSDDGAMALVFSGEIYNYLELREACVRDGQVLREHAAGEAGHAQTIWRMLVLEQWHRCVGDTSLAAGQAIRSAATNAALHNRETA
jgi:hypothetical protein